MCQYRFGGFSTLQLNEIGSYAEAYDRAPMYEPYGNGDNVGVTLSSLLSPQGPLGKRLYTHTHTLNSCPYVRHMDNPALDLATMGMLDKNLWVSIGVGFLWGLMT